MSFIATLRSNTINRTSFFDLNFNRLSLVGRAVFVRDHRRRRLAFFTTLKIFRQVRTNKHMKGQNSSNNLNRDRHQEYLTRMNSTDLLGANKTYTRMNNIRVGLRGFILTMVVLRRRQRRNLFGFALRTLLIQGGGIFSGLLYRHTTTLCCLTNISINRYNTRGAFCNGDTIVVGDIILSDSGYLQCVTQRNVGAYPI